MKVCLLNYLEGINMKTGARNSIGKFRGSLALITYTRTDLGLM